MVVARTHRFGRPVPLALLGSLIALLPLFAIPSHAAASGGGFANVASGGKCLTDPNSSKSVVQLVISSCTGSSTQDWLTLVPSGQWFDGGNPTPLVKNVYSGMCLDLAGNSGLENGVAAWQYPCNFNDTAQWMTMFFNSVPGNGPNIIKDDRGTCLDDKHGGTGNGNPVWFYQCNGTAAQQWNFYVDHGQQVALHDINGKVYSVKLEGINQNCQGIVHLWNFPNPHLDISGWYWMTWGGCWPQENQGLDVYMYSGSNGGGTYLGHIRFQVPTWQTYTTWYSQQIDGGSAGYPGENTV